MAPTSLDDEVPASLFGKQSRSVLSDSLQPLWTVALQAPLSMGFSRQELWSGFPLPPPTSSDTPLIIILHFLPTTTRKFSPSELFVYEWPCFFLISWTSPHALAFPGEHPLPHPGPCSHSPLPRPGVSTPAMCSHASCLSRYGPVTSNRICLQPALPKFQLDHKVRGQGEGHFCLLHFFNAQNLLTVSDIQKMSERVENKYK